MSTHVRIIGALAAIWMLSISIMVMDIQQSLSKEPVQSSVRDKMVQDKLEDLGITIRFKDGMTITSLDKDKWWYKGLASDILEQKCE